MVWEGILLTARRDLHINNGRLNANRTCILLYQDNTHCRIIKQPLYKPVWDLCWMSLQVLIEIN